VIAVVDDEDSVRKAVVRVLLAAGFSAYGFASGDEFLKSCQFDRPDCVLLDLRMPGLSGTEVQRALNLTGAKFRIIIITAYDEPSIREESMRLGAAAYLCKPLDISTLLQLVTPAADSSL
jgi:FixJ family two-component response regulator